MPRSTLEYYAEQEEDDTRQERERTEVLLLEIPSNNLPAYRLSNRFPRMFCLNDS